MKVIGKRVLTRVLKKPQMNESGIILDANFDAGYKSLNMPQWARVVSVGKEVDGIEKDDIVFLPIGQNCLVGFAEEGIQYTIIVDYTLIAAKYVGDIGGLGYLDVDEYEEMPDLEQLNIKL